MPNQKMLAEMDELHHDFLDLGRCVEDVVASIACAFHEPTLSGNTQICIEGATPSELGNRLTEQCQRILLLYQPVASDFREITVILLMVKELEQVAKLALAMTVRPEDRIMLFAFSSEEWFQLVESVHDMIRLALSAYEDRSFPLAQQVEQTHVEVTDLTQRLTEWLTGVMKADSTMIEAGLSLFAVLYHLQRIVDHVAGLTEQVKFLLEAPSNRFLTNNSRVVRVEPLHAHRCSW